MDTGYQWVAFYMSIVLPSLLVQPSIRKQLYQLVPLRSAGHPGLVNRFWYLDSPGHQDQVE